MSRCATAAHASYPARAALGPVGQSPAIVICYKLAIVLRRTLQRGHIPAVLATAIVRQDRRSHRGLEAGHAAIPPDQVSALPSLPRAARAVSRLPCRLSHRHSFHNDISFNVYSDAVRRECTRARPRRFAFEMADLDGNGDLEKGELEEVINTLHGGAVRMRMRVLIIRLLLLQSGPSLGMTLCTQFDLIGSYYIKEAPIGAAPSSHETNWCTIGQDLAGRREIKLSHDRVGPQPINHENFERLWSTIAAGKPVRANSRCAQ